MCGRTTNPQVVEKGLPPARALEFETNGMWSEIILFMLDILQLKLNVIIWKPAALYVQREEFK